MTAVPLSQAAPRSLLGLIKPSMTCWIWLGQRDSDGYGKYRGRGAHLYFWERLFGPVPAGLQIDHLCHTEDVECLGGNGCPHRGCVNPAHLEPVTQAENTRRASHHPGRPTHCQKGHEYVPDRPVGTPKRCLICLAEGRRAQDAARRQETQRYPRSSKP